MKKINLRTTIKLIHIVLGAAISVNVIYFVYTISKAAPAETIGAAPIQRDTEIQELIGEIEKNSQRIKEMVK